MFKSFCNSCGSETIQQKVGTRKFTRLMPSKSGEPLGLEAVLLCGDKPSPDLHLCDNCVLELVWRLAEHTPGTGLARRVKALAENELRIKNLNKSLDQRFSDITKAESEAKDLKQNIELQASNLSKIEDNLKNRESAVIQREHKLLEDQIALKGESAKLNKLCSAIHTRDEESKKREAENTKMVNEITERYQGIVQFAKETEAKRIENSQVNGELQKLKIELDARKKDVEEREGKVAEREQSVKTINSYLEKRVKDITEKEKLADKRDSHLSQWGEKLNTLADTTDKRLKVLQNEESAHKVRESELTGRIKKLEERVELLQISNESYSKAVERQRVRAS